MSIKYLSKQAIIFDMDGTLCDSSGRVVHLEKTPKDWDSFFGEMHLDAPIEAIAALAKILHETYAILVVTARPDDFNYRDVSAEWLILNNISHNKLYMRKKGDHRADHIVKAEILEEILQDGYDPILAIDDKANIAEMWRSFGITCLQCAPDEVRTNKYEGQTLLHMLVGPSGAGKSTYCAANYKPHDVISTDQLRRELFGDHQKGHNADELARTWKYAHGLIKARLDCGVKTVLDATNLKRKDRLAVLKQVPKGIVVQYVILDREYGIKLRDRGWRSEDLIARHHKSFKSSIKDILSGDNQPNVFVIDKREHKL